jgi:hypothetical protein
MVLALTAQGVAMVDGLVDSPSWPATVTQVLESKLEPLAFIDRLNDPRGIYAYCFCDTR